MQWLIFLLCVGLYVPCDCIELSEFQNDLSPETLMALNESKEFKRFDIKQIPTRRIYNFFHWVPVDWHTKYHFSTRIIYLMHYTYVQITKGLNDYYPLRYLYEKNVEYEVGYLTHEIVARYQNVIELYHYVYHRYYLRPHDYAIHSKNMLYFYVQILEFSQSIIHLCYMLHEVEDKFEKYKHSEAGKKPGVFEDYMDKGTSKRFRNRTKIIHTVDSDGEGDEDTLKEKKLAREARVKKSRLDKKKQFFSQRGKYVHTTQKPTPRKGIFDLSYGWSIEYW